MSVLELAEKLAKPENVLIVDDDPHVCASLAGVVERLGCRAVCAHSGSEAIAVLNTVMFAGVLLDIRMPGVNGFDMLRHMRENNLNVPVIIMTGYPDVDVYKLMDTFGVLAVVVKPFSFEELISTLCRFFDIFKVRHKQVSES